MKTESPKISRRCVDVLSWIVPGAILALTPKCPMCLAAYIAAWTGTGLSFPAATHLRAALLILCASATCFLFAFAVLSPVGGPIALSVKRFFFKTETR
jgi:hypothetical protein